MMSSYLQVHLNNIGVNHIYSPVILRLVPIGFSFRDEFVPRLRKVLSCVQSLLASMSQDVLKSATIAVVLSIVVCLYFKLHAILASKVSHFQLTVHLEVGAKCPRPVWLR